MIDWSTIPLGHGLGTQQRPCTIAAINLARNGHLTDDDPDGCMSQVVRYWVIAVQDAMPETMLAPDDEHGIRWREVAPSIAGSRTFGPSDEKRAAMIVEWMWDRLGWYWRMWVPEGASKAWEQMLSERNETTARTASDDAAWAVRTSYAAAVAHRDKLLALRHEAPANAASEAADVVSASTFSGHNQRTAYAAVTAARMVGIASSQTDRYWREADPAALLTKLVGPTGRTDTWD